MALDAYSYDGVASLYDPLAAFYSLGRIEASKQCHLRTLAAGESVLFAGVGSGSDAVAAARRGASVTAIDLSPKMLRRFSRRLSQEGLHARMIEGAVERHRPEALYDTVVAHYFLNLFDSAQAAQMLDALCRLVRPGGRLLFADFAPADGGRTARFVTAAYYRPVNWIAWALGYCALHPIPDYPALLAGAGARILSVTRFPVIPGFSNPAYHSVVAERVE